jgi:hypothetical protein
LLVAVARRKFFDVDNLGAARAIFRFEVLVKLSYETLLRTLSVVQSHRGEA